MLLESRELELLTPHPGTATLSAGKALTAWSTCSLPEGGTGPRAECLNGAGLFPFRLQLKDPLMDHSVHKGGGKGRAAPSQSGLSSPCLLARGGPAAPCPVGWPQMPMPADRQTVGVRLRAFPNFG